MAKHGDLGGIVFNVRSKQLVGGHKRVESFKADPKAAVTVTDRLKKPDNCGTVAYGHVTFAGTRHSYREVDWDEATEMAANLAANQFGAEFDWQGVGEMLTELKGTDLALTGFAPGEIETLMKKLSAPAEFPAVDENLPVEHRCPKCAYTWSGRPS